MKRAYALAVLAATALAAILWFNFQPALQGTRGGIAFSPLDSAPAGVVPLELSDADVATLPARAAEAIRQAASTRRDVSPHLSDDEHDATWERLRVLTEERGATTGFLRHAGVVMRYVGVG